MQLKGFEPQPLPTQEKPQYHSGYVLAVFVFIISFDK